MCFPHHDWLLFVVKAIEFFREISLTNIYQFSSFDIIAVGKP